MKRTLWMWLPLTVVLTGCFPVKYTITVTPRGKVLHRQLVLPGLNVNEATETSKTDPAAKKAASACLQKELASIALAYGTRVPPLTDGKYTFEGMFVGVTPKDIGGAGSYTVLTSDMGHLGRYSERFRGNDDSAAQIERAYATIDQFTDILIDWVKFRLGKDEMLPKLQRILHEDIRRDAKNIALMCWAMGFGQFRGGSSANESISQASMLARISQYLIERKYISHSEVMGTGGVDPDEFVSLIARKAGIEDSRQVKRLTKVLNPNSETFLAWYAKSPHATRARVQWMARMRRLRTDGTKNPKPEELLLVTAQPLLSFVLGAHIIPISVSGDLITVQMPCASKPLATNGDWSAEKQAISWVGAIHAVGEDPWPVGIPFFCFASVAIPNEAMQRGLFGRTVLDGDKLESYCRWYAQLTELEKAKWQGCLATLRPGTDPTASLKAFRFRSGRPTPSTSVEQGAQLLIKALEIKK